MPSLRGVPSRFLRRRYLAHRGLRIAIVVGVIIGLTYVMLSAFLQGPPIADDPLTGHWTYTIDPGNRATLTGFITGGDYVTGNFSVLYPPGADTTFAIYNVTEAHLLDQNRLAVPVTLPINETGGIIVYSPSYTDMYSFVWTNHYSSLSHITLTVYVQTKYMPNVNVA